MKPNKQAPEPRAQGDGSTLSVHSIFHTIQGEGIYSGVPSVFIRLAGCNLQCPGCDTEYTAERKDSTAVDWIVKHALARFPETVFKRPRLFVITGGEPFRQNIALLCTKLLVHGAMVQVETNGTFAPPEHFDKKIKVVCSPKAGRVADSLVPFISAYKYVIEAQAISTADGLPTSILGKANHRPARPHGTFKGPVYLSPMDVQDPELNEANRRATVASCLQFGYILNLQLHKLVGLP